MEAALALPIVLLVLVAAVQFALVYHAQSIVDAAAQEGARLAAAEGRTAADGARRAHEVLTAALGSSGEAFTVEAIDGGAAVEVNVSGAYPLFIPWVSGSEVPIDVSATVREEAFRSGP